MIGDIKEWKWYQAGINYNNRLKPSYYDLVDCNWDFFYGFHWRNAGLSDDYPQPVFNKINRAITFSVASIMATKTGVSFASPVTLSDEDNSDEIVNQEWKSFEERVKLDWNTKNALYDGAVTGDYVAHLIFDATKKPFNGAYSEVLGEIDFELVDPNNFYMSNPNSKDVQSQTFIQVVGRDMTKNLIEEGKEVAKQFDEDEIESDYDTKQQASKYGQIELEDIKSDDGEENGKATYVITYTKKKVEEEIPKLDENKQPMLDELGKAIVDKKKVTRVFASKCTISGYIYKDIDLGVDLYPVALGNWELQRNTYHGMSFVQSAIPAQIFINRGFAMAMKNTIDTSFPIFAYDNSMMNGKTNRISTQFGLDLKPGQRIQDAATYIAPGSMSSQVIPMIELSDKFLDASIGMSDALLGNINPEQASGTSIAAVTKQGGIPLENPKFNMANWKEDIARIFYNMISNLYGNRPVIATDDEGNNIIEEFDFDSLNRMYKVPTVDVGPSTYLSEISEVQMLDKMLEMQQITFLEWLEGLPEGWLSNKSEWIRKVKLKEEEQKQVENTEEQFMTSLPPEIQAILQQMEPEEAQATLQELMALPDEELQSALQEIMGGVQ